MFFQVICGFVLPLFLPYWRQKVLSGRQVLMSPVQDDIISCSIVLSDSQELHFVCSRG